MKKWAPLSVRKAYIFLTSILQQSLAVYLYIIILSLSESA